MVATRPFGPIGIPYPLPLHDVSFVPLTISFVSFIFPYFVSLLSFSESLGLWTLSFDPGF
jgi:hypothetical protein